MTKDVKEKKHYIAFILGRDPLLAVAELQSQINVGRISGKIVEFNENVALVETTQKVFFLKKTLNYFGGIPKIGKIIGAVSTVDEVPNTFSSFLYDEVFKKLPSVFHYSISSYGLPLSTAIPTVNMTKDAIELQFKELKVKGEFHPPQRETYSDLVLEQPPKDIIRYKMNKTRTDFIIANVGKKIHLGYTLAVYSPKKHQFRDLKRPVKDYSINISIRMAQILINLCQVREGETLLDPFCGVGTILQEALRRKIHVIGSDIDPEIIKAAKKNIRFYRRIYQLPQKKVKSSLYTIDAQKLSKHFKKNSIDGIVTEPYLGPLLKDYPSKHKAYAIIDELTPLYEQFFKEAHRLLRPNKRMVIILPYFKTRKKDKIQLPLENFVKNTTFQISDPLKEAGFQTSCIPYDYSSPTSKIGREIYIFVKKR